MTKDEPVYDSLMYELAALGRGEPGHIITGETREEIRESLRAALDAMDCVAGKLNDIDKK